MDTLLSGRGWFQEVILGGVKVLGLQSAGQDTSLRSQGGGGVSRQMQIMVEKGFWASLQASETGPLGSMDLEALLLQTLQGKGVSAEVTREGHMAFSGSGQILSLFCGLEIGGLV